MENLKEKKILIVDDEPEIQIMIERFLRKEGFFRIYTANDCASALSICKIKKPDIIILDIMLPDGDGFSLFSKISLRIFQFSFFQRVVKMKTDYLDWV